VDTLNESDVHIWCRCTSSLDDQAVKTSEQYLSIHEQARRNRLRLEADRRDFTFAHDLLRRTLSNFADLPPGDWRFSVNDYGKPSIDSNEPRLRALSFNLSHTRGCVACAIALNGPLGVDVERIEQSQHLQGIADQYFSEEEAAWLSACSNELRSVRIIELWTLKEAYLKAIGVGLFGSPADISFRFDEHAQIEFMGPPANDPHEWHFALFEPFHDVRLGIAICGVARPRLFLSQYEGDERTLPPIRGSAKMIFSKQT
jgi:4'-phosphopantetheinyl transferase